ncbi:hypothetical protein EPD60_04115 [Flaviaesturariibacter flavus]|uniref:Uncharacterized protein n=1 Tax=Flaviaesturariibacter flavus TaxID=2502780 RepID=A0A4R1BLD0_9BACT|nr:hypothetical protein [Flaviaesturariibacter flavus]TCJ18230.1 hypothetical protein EPD60_04115 [Flaviaesturariibacter flavus]
MKKVYLLACFFLLATAGFAQPKFKIDKNTGLVTVAGKPAFRYERDGCGLGDGMCGYDVYDTSGTRVLRILMKTQQSRRLITHENPKGEVSYFQFLFVQSKQSADVASVAGWERSMVSFILQHKLFRNGLLDAERAEEFILLYGTPYSSLLPY